MMQSLAIHTCALQMNDNEQRQFSSVQKEKEQVNGESYRRQVKTGRKAGIFTVQYKERRNQGIKRGTTNTESTSEGMVR